MRVFSDAEKFIMRKFVELNNKKETPCLQNVIEPFLPKHTEIKFSSNGSIDIYFYQEKIDEKFIFDIRPDIENLIYKVKNLLIFLKIEKYIELVQIFSNVDSIGDPIRNSNSVPTFFSIHDTELYQTIKDFSKFKFIPQASLEKLVKDDFKSEEQLRFDKQMNQNKRTMIISQVSMWVGIISTFVTIYYKFHDQSHPSKIQVVNPIAIQAPVVLDTSTTHLILDDVIETLAKNQKDSIYVHVIQPIKNKVNKTNLKSNVN